MFLRNSILSIVIVLCTFISFLIWSVALHLRELILDIFIEVIKLLSLHNFIKNKLEPILAHIIIGKVILSIAQTDISRGRKQRIQRNSMINHHNYAKALSSILGITFESTGEDNYKHGLVFTSINQGRKSESIITSNPNI